MLRIFILSLALTVFPFEAPHQAAAPALHLRYGVAARLISSTDLESGWHTSKSPRRDGCPPVTRSEVP
jgi:hypothetical protein